MNNQEKIELRRFFEWADDMNTKSCRNCQWGSCDQYDIMITCGSHLENFSINSSCGSWTSPTDVDLLNEQEKRKKELCERFKKLKNKKEFKIGEKALRMNKTDGHGKWVEFTVNETYLPLTKEFPEDYKHIN